jgi:hypothetical protein
VNTPVSISGMLVDTDALAQELAKALPNDYHAHEDRDFASGVACSLSLEHWLSVRILLSQEVFASAVVVHRAQFEAVVRSIWLLYAASGEEVRKLSVDLSMATEQGAKNIAGMQEMILDIGKRGPTEAFSALTRFRENALKPINSYVHAGIHALHRHAYGYPVELCAGVLKNANGVAVLSFMQRAALLRRNDLQRILLEIAARHATCLPTSV